MDPVPRGSIAGRARPWSAAPLRPSSSSAALSTRLQQQRPWSAVCVRAEHLSERGGVASSTHGPMLDDTCEAPWPSIKSRPSLQEFPDAEPRRKSCSSTHPPVTTSLGRWADYFNIGQDGVAENLTPLNRLADCCISPYKGYILNARHWLHNSSIAVALLRKLLQEHCFLGGSDFVREKKQPSLQHLAGNEAIDVLLRAVAELCDQVALYHDGLHRAHSFKAEQEAEALRKQVAELTAEYNAEKLRRLDTHDRLRKAQQSGRWAQRMTEIPMSQWFERIVDGGSELLKEVMETSMPTSDSDETPVMDWPHAMEVLDKAWAVRYHEAQQKAEADVNELRREKIRLTQSNDLLRERAKDAEVHTRQEGHTRAKAKPAPARSRSASTARSWSPSKPRQSVARQSVARQSVARQSVARQSVASAKGEKQNRAAGSAYAFAFGTKVYANRSASLTAPAALPSELHQGGSQEPEPSKEAARQCSIATGKRDSVTSPEQESWAKMRQEAHSVADERVAEELRRSSLSSGLPQEPDPVSKSKLAEVNAAATAPAALETVPQQPLETAPDHDVTMIIDPAIEGAVGPRTYESSGRGSAGSWQQSNRTS
mmetsp:Transcript_25473/g.58729  ORF Transcript_25473/g.58729 Transcript_25473/m.58729 type:complete len:599 (+) Transcript_25473:23-1819(+)